MYKGSIFVGLLMSLLSALALAVSAHGADFYQGKTIKLVVGYPVRGTYHVSARLTAAHIGRHIPGNPNIVVRNMPGAGSRLAASYIASHAAPDGLTMGMWNSVLVLREALGEQDTQLRQRHVRWVGAPFKATLVCVFMRSSNIRTLEDVLKKPVKMGAIQADFNTVKLPTIMNEVLNTKFEVKSDYKSVAKIGEAMRSGNVGGFCSSEGSTRDTVAELKRNSDGEPIVAVIHRTWDDPKTKDFPTLWEAYRKKEGKKRGAKALAILQAYLGPTLFMRPLAVHPDTSPDHLKILQKAFADTVKDKDFLAVAEKENLIINPVKGEEVEEQVNKIFSMPDEVKRDLARLVLQK